MFYFHCFGQQYLEVREKQYDQKIYLDLLTVSSEFQWLVDLYIYPVSVLWNLFPGSHSYKSKYFRSNGVSNRNHSQLLRYFLIYTGYPYLIDPMLAWRFRYIGSADKKQLSSLELHQVQKREQKEKQTSGYQRMLLGCVLVRTGQDQSRIQQRTWKVTCQVQPKDWCCRYRFLGCRSTRGRE